MAVRVCRTRYEVSAASDTDMESAEGQVSILTLFQFQCDACMHQLCASDLCTQTPHAALCLLMSCTLESQAVLAP